MLGIVKELKDNDNGYPTGPWHFEDVEGKPGLCTLVDESPKPFDKKAYEVWRAPLLIKRK